MRTNEIRLERRAPHVEEVFARGESVGLIRRYHVGGFTGWEVNDGRSGWQTLPGAAHEVKTTAILALVKLSLKAARTEARQTTMTLDGDALQETIGTWAEATFPDQTDLSIVRHLAEEFGELAGTVNRAKLLGGVQIADIADDCADIAILVLALAHRCGFSLADAIQAKHAVNTERTWTFDAARGYDKHVEAGR